MAAPTAVVQWIAYLHGRWNGAGFLDAYPIAGTLGFVIAAVAWFMARRICVPLDDTPTVPRASLIKRVLMAPLLLLILAVLGFFTYAMAGVVLKEYRLVVSPGTQIVEATAISRRECRTSGGYRRGGSAGWAVSYTYEIEGKRFEFSPGCRSIHKADPLGVKMMLKYSPGQPDKAHRVGAGALTSLSAVAVFMALMTLIFVRIIWRRIF